MKFRAGNAFWGPKPLRTSLTEAQSHGEGENWVLPSGIEIQTTLTEAQSHREAFLFSPPKSYPVNPVNPVILSKPRFFPFHSFRGALALGAEVGGALADEDALNRSAAAGTGRAGLSVGVELFLVPAALAARQDEMGPARAERGAEVPDAAPQHRPDRPEQFRRLRGRQGIRPPARMQPRGPEGFIGIDIADARQEVLIKQ